MTAKPATRPIGVLVALSAALLLAGCSMGSVIADVLPASAGGLPASAPARLDQPAEYPAVHDMPPKRDEKMLSGTEQLRLEKDLEDQRMRVTGEKAPPKAAPAKAGGATSAKAAGSSKTGTPLAITGGPSGTGGSRNP